MTHEKAKQIANEFLKDMNPSLWDGHGDRPDDFNYMIWEDTESLKDAGMYSLQITFEEDERFFNGDLSWGTYVVILDTNSDEVVQYGSCYGIDCALDIANLIMEVCGWSGLKGV